MNERPNQLFSRVEKVKYKDLLIYSLLMPFSVLSLCTPWKQLQFLHIVVGSSVDERIDGEQTPDLFCIREIKYFSIKGNIYEA